MEEICSGVRDKGLSLSSTWEILVCHLALYGLFTTLYYIRNLDEKNPQILQPQKIVNIS